jgi:hypothetical protein
MTACTALRLATFAVALATLPASAEVISVAPRDTAGLIAAIEHANENPGEDIIELAAGSLYAIDRAINDEQAQGLPTIRSRIRILGNGAEIRAYTREPLLLVNIANSGTLRLEHLTLAEGTKGAVVNRGDLEIWRVAVVDNSATGSNAIVTNYGTLFGRHSEIAYNELIGTQRDAGIVLNYGKLDLAFSSLQGNRVLRRYASLVSASAILNLGMASLREVSVTDNAADADADARSAALVALGNGRFEQVGTRFERNAPDASASLYIPN